MRSKNKKQIPAFRSKNIGYISITLKLLLLCGFFGTNVMAKPKLPVKSKANTTTKRDQIASVRENNLKSDSLVTFESITARSGKLLQPFLDKEPTLTDSLQTAMELAYKTNPNIASQRAALRSVDESIVQAKAGWRPSINAQLSSGYDSQRNSGDSVDNNSTPRKIEGNSQSAQVSANYNLFNGGATVAQTAAAKANIESQRAALIDTEQNILLTTVQAYLGLIAKLAQLEVLRSNEEFLKTTLQSTRDKFKVGEETRTSVAQGEAQLAESTARLQIAESQLVAAIATYEQVVGRKPGKLLRPMLPKFMPRNLKEALEKASLNSPILLRSKYNEIAARQRIEEINGGLAPKIDLQASSNVLQSRNRKLFVDKEASKGTDVNIDHKLMVYMGIPIYEAGTVRSQKRQAIEDAENNRIQIEVGRRQVEQELIQTFQEYEAAKNNINNYKEQVRAYEISVEGTRQEVLVGSKILIDVLNAQKQLREAQQVLVEAEQSYYFSAYKIMLIVGMLTAKSMQLEVDYYDPKAHYKAVKNAW